MQQSSVILGGLGQLQLEILLCSLEQGKNNIEETQHEATAQRERGTRSTNLLDYIGSWGVQEPGNDIDDVCDVLRALSSIPLLSNDTFRSLTSPKHSSPLPVSSGRSPTRMAASGIPVARRCNHVVLRECYIVGFSEGSPPGNFCPRAAQTTIRAPTHQIDARPPPLPPPIPPQHHGRSGERILAELKELTADYCSRPPRGIYVHISRQKFEISSALPAPLLLCRELGGG